MVTLMSKAYGVILFIYNNHMPLLSSKSAVRFVPYSKMFHFYLVLISSGGLKRGRVERRHTATVYTNTQVPLGFSEIQKGKSMIGMPKQNDRESKSHLIVPKEPHSRGLPVRVIGDAEVIRTSRKDRVFRLLCRQICRPRLNRRLPNPSKDQP